MTGSSFAVGLHTASVLDAPISLGRLVFLVAFGVLVVATIVIRFEHARAVYGSDDATREPKTNCPSCGARILAESDVCEYCEESLTDNESGYGWIDD
ncbi:hypothetical protein [Natronorubrum aibiense]|uniref:Zinc ribbon domain-containing protein n=1 Tax=Natronorubrum aibiense TaxID=348826 RepID=A0A5P9P5N4_9EURY|nr:hypothetical protein [Natronorubrum aibiense]QFU83438.1 hypothetical protein GCU68_13255 [Natronorubrum aibiense]